MLTHYDIPAYKYNELEDFVYYVEIIDIDSKIIIFNFNQDEYNEAFNMAKLNSEYDDIDVCVLGSSDESIYIEFVDGKISQTR